MDAETNMSFEEAVRGFMAGDFSRLAPLFNSSSEHSVCPVIQWLDDGLFVLEPTALAEAFTCACFNGCTDSVEQFLARGVNPSGGNITGLNAVHWAVNRGQLPTVNLLIQHKAPLETRNAYGGTVLGCAVWSAVHEPKPDHVRIIETLLNASAHLRGAAYPTGVRRVDEVLERHGAPGRP